MHDTFAGANQKASTLQPTGASAIHDAINTRHVEIHDPDYLNAASVLAAISLIQFCFTYHTCRLCWNRQHID